MKKKLMMLAGTLMLAMLLAACGSEEAPAEPTPTAVPTATIAPTATATPTPEPTATSTPTPEPTATSTPTPVPAQAGTYEKGIITADGYESKWMDLRFTTQPEMHMMTQEELDAAMKQSMGMVYGEDAEAVLDYTNLTTVSEMLAQSADGANVVVQVERLPVLYAAMTEEEYISLALSNLANSAAQPDIITGENYYEAELGGATYLGLSTGEDYHTGVIVYQEFLVRKMGERMISVVVSYADDSVEGAQRLLQCFGAYDSEPIVLPEVTAAPTIAPTVTGGEFEPGVVTEAGYENKWLNLRIALPEGVTLTEENEPDAITLEMAWDFGVPVVQVMAEMTAEGEETPEAHIEAMKDVFVQLGQDQGMTYTFGEELYLVEIGGQEYLDLFMQVSTSDGVIVYQDYCVRVQDDYTVVLVFTYADGFDAELEAALNMFQTY